MNVIYQRELYRSEVCFELEQKETGEKYALEMCLRNPIAGLRPCHLSRQDGKTFLCWDVTSTVSLKKQLDNGQMSAKLLERLIRGMDSVRLELERFLIDPAALFPDPEYIFTDAACEEITFILNFEAPGGFRERWQQLCESLLERISHRDGEQMRLAYGFYRLSVGEVYDETGIRDLLAGKGEAPVTPEADPPFKEEASIPDQQEILEHFLAEEEQETKGRFRFPGYLPVYGSVTFLLFAGAETVGYYRNGHHLSPAWAFFGLTLWLCATALSAVLEIFLTGRKDKAQRREPEPAVCPEKHKPGEIRREKEAAPPPERSGAANDVKPAGLISPAPPRIEASSDTVYLGVYELDLEQKIPALVFHETGDHFKLNPGGTIVGKMPDVADLVLDRVTVSRIHARVFRSEDRWMVEDLNSRNGTAINGRVIPAGNPRELFEGDRITFADALFTFQLDQEG